MHDPLLSCGCPQCRGATATAAGAVSAGPVSTSGTYYIDALLAESGTSHWNTTVGTAVTVSYSFLSSLPAIYTGAEESQGFGVLNSTQESVAQACLALYAEIANLSFTQTTGSLGQIRFGTAALPSSTAAWAYYPGTGTGGDVWINNQSSSNTSPSPGSYGYTTFLHEIGHALGLKHPGNYNAGGGGTEGPYLPSAEDSAQYTMMSYMDHPSVYLTNPRTPLLYDIAAIQYLYGANTATRSGNTTYSWSAGQSVIEALWDGGGTDTIDASNQSAAQTIDLRAGAFSSIAGETDNIAIAYGALIENAIGGTGSDRLVGNSAANRLEGGSGNDSLEGGGGNDTLEGGAGLDWVTLGDAGGMVAVSGVETLRGGAGADTVALGGSGNAVLLARIEALSGSDGGDWVTLTALGHTMTVSGIETLRGGNGADVITLGDAGNRMIVAALDTLAGGAGGDWITLSHLGSTMLVSGVETLRGGNGADVVTLGGSGNTLILAGIDTLTGSSGVDVVTLSNIGVSLTLSGIEALTGGAGGDWVTVGSAGTTMTVSGVETLRGGSGADVVTLGGTGNTLILAAVDTLAGSSGVDVVTLSNLGATMAVSGIESLTGGAAADRATVGGGNLRFQGNGGADTVTLQAGAGSDTIVFASVADGGAAGVNSGFDTYANVQASADGVVIAGTLRTAIDDNGDGALAAATRAAGAVNLGTDELVVLSTAAAALADADFAAFRTALGTVSGSSAGADALVLANTGVDSGLYVITDSDGNGTIAASETRLLATFSGTTGLTAGRFSLG